jgi:hypothetical protein
VHVLLARQEMRHRQRGQFGRARNDYGRGAVPNCIAQVVVAIEALALQREEDVPLPDFSGIGRDPANPGRPARRRPRQMGLECRCDSVQRPETRAHA